MVSQETKPIGVLSCLVSLIPSITSILVSLTQIRRNKTEVTSVKLVLFKYVMSFETLTKVDQLTDILRFG